MTHYIVSVPTQAVMHVHVEAVSPEEAAHLAISHASNHPGFDVDLHTGDTATIFPTSPADFYGPTKEVLDTYDTETRTTTEVTYEPPERNAP